MTRPKVTGGHDQGPNHIKIENQNIMYPQKVWYFLVNLHLDPVWSLLLLYALL